MSDLHQIYFCILPISVARSASCDVAILYVLPVLWMTSFLCLHMMARNRRRNSDSVGSSMNLSPWRILKLTHQGAAQNRDRRLISTIALLETSFRVSDYSQG